MTNHPVALWVQCPDMGSRRRRRYALVVAVVVAADLALLYRNLTKAMGG